MGVKHDWKANDRLGKLPKARKIANDRGEVRRDEFENMTTWHYQWARDMHTWGQRVREDIRRIENHLRLAAGDPGDPPNGPPPDEEGEE